MCDPTYFFLLISKLQKQIHWGKTRGQEGKRTNQEAQKKHHKEKHTNQEAHPVY